MAFFSQLYDDIPELLVGPQKDNDRGWVAAVLQSGTQAPGRELSLSDALTNTDLEASFVFDAVEPSVKNVQDARDLVELVQRTVARRGSRRGIVWLSAGKSIADQNYDSQPSLCINSEGSQVNYALSMPLDADNQDISFYLDNGMFLSLDDETLCFKNSGYSCCIHFEGPAAPPAYADNGVLPFSGPERGCIAFDIGITSGFLYNTWFWGFQFQVPWTNDNNDESVITEWLPFASEGPDESDICFSCVFDPGDVFNQTLDRRTLLKFTGQTQTKSDSSPGQGTLQPTSLQSYYRTTTGAKVILYPIGGKQAGAFGQTAGLAFARGLNLGKNKNKLYVTPVGDFAVFAPTAPSSTRTRILCGLQGTEFISLQPQSETYAGDRLRFIGSQPAYGYCYPLPQASPVGPPVDTTKPLLDDTFITSWAIAVSAPGDNNPPGYVAQPPGAPLYGQDQVIHPKDGNLLGAMDPGTGFDGQTLCFPMPPYAGLSAGDGQFTFKIDLIGLFERQFLSPTRRARIGTGKPVPSALGYKMTPGSNGATFNATTPSGQLVTINGDTGEWEKILLAQLIQSQKSLMYFQAPRPQLKQAFQTSDIMLVVTDPKYLKADGDYPNAAFNNSLNIEDWVLTAQVGENCTYGNYANVIIVKGRKGKLFDPSDDSESLAANPAKWTQKEDFAAPNGKVDELIPLSQWLLDYFRDAAEKTQSSSDPEALYFKRFNKIVQDENWTGILVLRARIVGLPEQLKGISAGISDPSRFYAHHFAIETGQIYQDENGVNLKDSSSVYGLIYYNDPAYDPSKPTEPVPPDAGSTFDFRLLTLKVLFENSSVKYFQSYTQLTLNQLFGSQVTGMGDTGNMYNSIILRGSFQENNGKPVYGLGTLQDYVFLFDNDALNKIEIASAQMTTRLATDENTSICFGMTGYLDFATLQTSPDDGSDAIAIDMFSFGSVDGKTLRSGLHFSNLGLAINYPTKTPNERTFVFDTDEIRFDVTSSTIRENSLYQSFALDLEGLVSGDGQDNTLSRKGYLNVITDLRLCGVGSNAWNGLKFRLNLGTPGQLAGKIGLNADLLLAWSPLGSQDSDYKKGSDYKVEAGLHLPGVTNSANLLSLQGVLKLSFGPLRLVYAKDPNAKSGRRFMLLLTDIALKFLGLLKIPPNAAICFYLFGDPKSEDKPSGLGWYTAYKSDAVAGMP